MGGGAAMRAASKVAGPGVVNGSLLGRLSSATAGPPGTQSLRNVSRPVAATISGGKVSGRDVAEAHKASWEMDDWEFMGGEGDLVVESSEPMARVVFGVAPSLEEAKKATSELKDALDKVYLSSPNSSVYEHGGPGTIAQVSQSGMSLLSNSEYTETKRCIPCDPKSQLVPNQAMQAFRMLSESPEVQSVVASIASDQKVWNAFMENETLVEFIQSQKNNYEYKVQESVKKFDEASDSSIGDNESGVADSKSKPMGFFQRIKHTVVGMVSYVADNGRVQTIKQTVVGMVINVADHLQSIFVSPTAEKASAEADARANFMEKTTLGASIFGLAVMVIMVVVLKRV